MMEQLNTFIKVKEAGSFSKAAQQLFISSTAVMKQMNLLEKSAGLPLFTRTNHGVELTEAGEAFSKDAAFILQYYQESLLRMRLAAQASQKIIRIGTSMLYPCKALLDLWNEVSALHPQYKIKLVHFEDDAHTLPATFRTLGEQLDFIVGPTVHEIWTEHYQMLELSRCGFCFALSRNHRLAGNKALSFNDLYGETLAIVNGGNNKVITEIRSYLMQHHPQIRIKDIPRLFDIDVFNRCEESNTLLLSLDTWSDIHPSLVTLPSELNYTVPYGLLYPVHPSEEVNRFVDILKEQRAQQIGLSLEDK